MSEKETEITEAKPVKEIVARYNKLAPSQDKLDIRDDREKLISRLRLSREELDTYIKHSKKIIEEKKVTERENTALKAQIEVLTAKIARLEKFEATLRLEFSQLCNLLHDPGFTAPDSDASSYSQVRESLSKLLDDPNSTSSSNKFFDELDRIKQEIIEKQSILVKLEGQIMELEGKTQNALCRARHGSRSSSSNANDENANHLKQEIDEVSDKIDPEEVKNKLAESYLDQLGQIKDLIEKLDTNRLCKINKDHHMPDLEQLKKILKELPADESVVNALTVEFNKKLKVYVDNLISQIEYLDKKAYDFFQDNESLSTEISSLKYALSHRLEMEQVRQASKVVACNCSAELNELKEELQRTKRELKNKEIELEIAEENKYSLIQLMASMTDTARSGSFDEVEPSGIDNMIDSIENQ